MFARNLRGVIPILVTPFHEDESLDLESLEALVRFNVRIGVDAVTVLGVLGESNRLTDAERSAVISTAVSAAGSLPVIVGTAHTGTVATIALSRQAIMLGAAGVMISPSAQPVPSDQVVTDYLRRVASEAPAPILLQDYPANSQVHMSVDLLVRLTREVPAISAIKSESVPSPEKICALKSALEGDRDIAVLAGLGALYSFFDLERGADGFNTGFAFPEVLLEMLKRFRSGNREAARRVYAQYLPLIVFEQQPGVAIRKEVLRRRGLIKSGCVRHPGRAISSDATQQLTVLLDETFPKLDLTLPLQLSSS